MTRDQREIHRKERVLEYAKPIGDINKACRYFGVSRSSFYEWRDRHRDLDDQDSDEASRYVIRRDQTKKFDATSAKSSSRTTP